MYFNLQRNIKIKFKEYEDVIILILYFYLRFKT